MDTLTCRHFNSNEKHLLLILLASFYFDANSSDERKDSYYNDQKQYCQIPKKTHIILKKKGFS